METFCDLTAGDVIVIYGQTVLLVVANRMIRRPRYVDSCKSYVVFNCSRVCFDECEFMVFEETMTATRDIMMYTRNNIIHRDDISIVRCNV